VSFLTILLFSTTISYPMPSQQTFSSKDGAVYTTSNGAPVIEPYAASKLGSNGPLLLQGARVP
jgi:catalase